MQLFVKKALGTCTVQDLGRRGWSAHGVPQGGAADALSLQLANFLCGNAANAPAIEVSGGVFQAQVVRQGWLALVGAGGQLFLDGKALPSGALAFVPEHTRLEIKPLAGGVFAYLATAGGWVVPLVGGSASTCLAGQFGGLEGRRLLAGDVLSGPAEGEAPFRKFQTFGKVPPPPSGLTAAWVSPWRVWPNTFIFNPFTKSIRVMPGPEMSLLSLGEQQRFFETKWKISPQSSRMGIRLEGEPLRLEGGGSMWSAGVVPGTVQLPPGGLPIVLSADAQTTGGYARIAQVYAVDLPKLAQMPPGSVFQFLKGDVAEAERALGEQNEALARVNWALAASSSLKGQ